MNCESELAFGLITSIKKPPVMATRAFVGQTEISALRKLLQQQSGHYAIACEHKRGKTVGNAGQYTGRHINLNIQTSKPQPMPGHVLIGGSSFACCDGAAEIEHLVRCAQRQKSSKRDKNVIRIEKSVEFISSDVRMSSHPHGGRV